MKLIDYKKELIINSINFAKYVNDGQSMPVWHWHPNYELIFITQGKYTLENNSKIISSDKPLVIIHMPYTLHSLNAESGTPYIRYIMYFRKDALSQLPQSITESPKFKNATLIYAFPNSDELSELKMINQQLTQYSNKNSCDIIMSKLYLSLLVKCTINIVDRGRGEIVSTSLSYISEALRFISENISESQTVENLAARYGVCQTKFYSDFKANTGMTYKKYLTKLRQTRARELLESGSSIVNASLDVGYSSEAHFIKAFRKYWGMTPGEYLKSRIDIYSKT